MLSKYRILLSILEVAMKNNTSVKVSKRYQIAVPAIARHLLDIKIGDRLLVDIQDGIMLLIPKPDNFTDGLAGLHQEIWQGVNTQQYIDEQRDAWASSTKD
jgi:AbrB family looped-hinge helix DNA binding protein